MVKRGSKSVAALTLALTIFNSSGVVFAADNVTTLKTDIQTFEASIDSGTATSQDAIDTLAQAVATQDLALADVNSFAESQMTQPEYAAFEAQINASLFGIDPSTLTPTQLGQIVGDAVAKIHSEGLYWSGCAEVWTGVGVIAAAVVLGIIAIIKSKSVSAIQTDYGNQLKTTTNNDNQNISNTQTSYTNQINATNNWQTAFPQEISGDNSSIQQDNSNINGAVSDENVQQNYINELNYQYNNTNMTDATYNAYYQQYTSAINNDENEVSEMTSAIQSATQNIANLQALIAKYTADPGQAAVDAANLQTESVQAIAQLKAQEVTDIANVQAQEASAVAAAPSNQALGLKLGIGAGIGAAAGAVLLGLGIHNGVDCGGD